MRPVEPCPKRSPLIVAGIMEVEGDVWRSRDAEPELEERLAMVFADGLFLPLEVYANNGRELWSRDITVGPDDRRYADALEPRLSPPCSILECIPTEFSKGGWVASVGALCAGMFFSRTNAPTLEGGRRDWMQAAKAGGAAGWHLAASPATCHTAARAAGRHLEASTATCHLAASTAARPPTVAPAGSTFGWSDPAETGSLRGDPPVAGAIQRRLDPCGAIHLWLERSSGDWISKAASR